MAAHHGLDCPCDSCLTFHHAVWWAQGVTGWLLSLVLVGLVAVALWLR